MPAGEGLRAISVRVSGIIPGPAGGGWPGAEGRRRLGIGASFELGGGDGADDQGGVPGDRGVPPGPGIHPTLRPGSA